MNKFFLIIKIFFLYLLLISSGITKDSNYLKKGIEFFHKKDFNKSKILFEKDLVFDPKSEKSYLYLAKIFNSNENDWEQEINLNTVLILNPKNEEAVYMLALLKIKQFDYEDAKKLVDQFFLICKSLCSKKKELQEKFDKLTPKNAKNNN